MPWYLSYRRPPRVFPRACQRACTKKKDVSEWKIVRSFVQARALFAPSTMRRERFIARCATDDFREKRGISRVERWGGETFHLEPTVVSLHSFSRAQSEWDNRGEDRCGRGEESPRHATRKNEDVASGQQRCDGAIEWKTEMLMRWSDGTGKPGKRSPEEARGKKRNEKNRRARYKSLVQRRRARDNDEGT